MNPTNPSVALLVLTYGTRGDLLRRTLEAIKNSTRKPEQILVVDNGCNPPALLEGAASARLLRIGENSGSAGGYRRGLECLLEDPSWTHVWMLDDDNLPDRHCLERLLAFLSSLPENSIAVAHRPERREFQGLIESRGMPPPPRNSFQRFSLTGVLRPFLRSPSVPVPSSPIALSEFGYGGALVPRPILQDGHCLPDAKLFLYHDDSEWAWRLGRNGHHAYLCESAFIQDIDPPWGGFRRNGASPLFSVQSDRRKLWFSLRNRAWLEFQMGFSGWIHDFNAALWIGIMSAKTFRAERSFRESRKALRIAWRAYKEGSRGYLNPWPPEFDR